MERLRSFGNQAEAYEALSRRIEEVISQSISEKGNARVLLSGGSTPIPVYQKIAQFKIEYANVLFGLVDDRFVQISDPNSNEGVIRNIFTDVSSFQLLGMVKNADEYKESVDLCNHEYRKFQNGDIAILGMGSDGHFASLFPNDSASDIGLNAPEMACIATSAPNHPMQRISCNLSLLKSIKHRILLIIGDQKLEKLQVCKQEGTPISFIFDALTEIYYAP